MTAVFDLNTGTYTYYSLDPEQAVVAAYAQRERKDFSTWEYPQRYSHLVQVFDSIKPGTQVVTCGNQSCLRSTL